MAEKENMRDLAIEDGVAQNFLRIFGVPLKTFFNNSMRCQVMGFDLLAFDKWLGSEDGSIADVVEKRFGKEGRDLIERLNQAQAPINRLFEQQLGNNKGLFRSSLRGRGKTRDAAVKNWLEDERRRLGE